LSPLRRRQVRRLRAQQEAGRRGPETHVPACGQPALPSSAQRRGTGTELAAAGRPASLHRSPGCRGRPGKWLNVSNSSLSTGTALLVLLGFDWGGSLLDSAAAIVPSILAACRDLGLPAPPESRAPHVIGLGLGDALRHAVPKLPESDYPRMVERYRHHYLSRD